MKSLVVTLAKRAWRVTRESVVVTLAKRAESLEKLGDFGKESLENH